jgi:hypothetical protein
VLQGRWEVITTYYHCSFGAIKLMKNIYDADDYSRRTGSLLSRTFAKLRTPFLSTYALLRKSPPIWNLLNRSSKILFKKNLPVLDELQEKILDDLMTNGIALTNLGELFPDKNIIPSLIEAATLQKEKAALSKHKPFLRYALGSGSMIDLANPLVQLTIQPRILEIVNSYMSLCAKLTYFELATTNLIKNGDVPMGSQRWHRDPALHRLCKMFVYLTDVDENSGPFTYVVQSHSLGRFGKIFRQRQFGRHGFYPPDGAVEKLISKSDLKICTGKMGSVIFCDTTGLHKGGYSFSKPRTMYTSTYMSEGEITKHRYSYPYNFKEQLDNLDLVSCFAVT